ncbi:MAG: hypothetical protein JO115_25235 [Pseudonocardiales bacterium]|nr:hypothetical protein [Pseudonocardiales bacterium]
MAVNGEEIGRLQLEAAKNKRKWHRDPGVLVATLALVVSVITFIAGQLNLRSEREIQTRNQLSALIEQLPTLMAQDAQNPYSSARDSLDLIAGTAATLIDRLGAEASTPSEKNEVAYALLTRLDLVGAKRLATAAEQQATNVTDKATAEKILAAIDFEAGDAPGGRDEFRKVISTVQTPQKELDSPLVRDLLTFDTELRWISDEVVLAKSCQDAAEQLRNATQILDRLPSEQFGAQRTALDNTSKTVTTH